MAEIVIADSWADNLLGILLNGDAPPASFHYHAFVSDTTPGPTTALVSFTECTTPGYVTQNVAATGWTVATPVAGTNVATAPLFSWVVTDAVEVFGVFVTTPDDATLLWSQRFDSSVIFPSLGGTLVIEPTLEIVSPVA